MAKALVGSDRLRQWLEKRGFGVAENPIGYRDNECNWYAYKKSDLAARECETNEGKGRSIFVYPNAFTFNGTQHESVEVSVVGEASSIWFDIKAYSLTHSEFKKRLDDIERMLVQSWNALT